MITLHENIYTRVVKNNETWIVVHRITDSIVLCVREADVNSGVDQVTVMLMEI